jgi:hypothetical protein
VPRAETESAEQRIRRLARRSFLWGAGAGLAGLAAWEWLRTRAEDDGIAWPLRRVLEFNERLARGAFGPTRLAPTFPGELAREPPVNGDLGLAGPADPAAWRLRAWGWPGGRRWS